MMEGRGQGENTGTPSAEESEGLWPQPPPAARSSHSFNLFQSLSSPAPTLQQIETTMADTEATLLRPQPQPEEDDAVR